MLSLDKIKNENKAGGFISMFCTSSLFWYWFSVEGTIILEMVDIKLEEGRPNMFKCKI